MRKRAERLAKTAHKRQKDKAQKPYIKHVRRVAQEAEKKVSPELRDHAVVVAFLHDVVEDTSLKVRDIRAFFGRVVAEDVKTLTRRKDEKEYDDYINRVARGSETARTVKVADLEDHLLDTSHIEARHVDRYRRALRVLAPSRATDPAE